LSRAEAKLDIFLKRLAEVRILDPACGSGNFLYLALQSLKDLERRAIVEAVEMGLALRVVHCGPQNVKGIEINQYAAELARTSIWIGNIQWLRRNGFEARKEPVLEALDAIECRDALVTRQGVQSSPPLVPGTEPGSGRAEARYVETPWSEAEFIVGNPPFLGTKKMIAAFGEAYTNAIRNTYKSRLSPFSDLVCWWFEKAYQQIKQGKASRAGLVATNSISGGRNRLVLDKIASDFQIFEAWPDESWIVEGAAVRVAIVEFAKTSETARLDGKVVSKVASDLTEHSADRANFSPAYIGRISDNRAVAFIGTMKNGDFNMPGALAREWLVQPLNPNGRPNSDVLFPWFNGSDLVRRPSDQWIIDFGERTPLRDAALFEIPFERVRSLVKPNRDTLRRKSYREIWWLYQEPQYQMRRKLRSIGRFIATSRVSKCRLFVWMDHRCVPDSATVAIARDDNTTFGILHSRFHETWSLRLGTWLGVGNDPRYTPTTTFETFPFPEGLTPNIPAKDYVDDPRAIAIANVAKRLDELRNAWLNPPDLIDIVPEVVPGYPDRVCLRTKPPPLN
jgi:type II restriction/modification system DNA methylase subunit YeeA